MNNCERTKCATCEVGKVHRRPNKVNEIKKNHIKDQYLNKNHLLSGQMVSADHYISRDPGRLYHTKGKSDPSDIYSGVFVLIDHTSGYMSIKHELDIKATKTFRSKLTFERENKSKGVMVNVYHTDNGIFNNSKFMEGMLKKQQNIRFSGPKNLHQNGSAERTIKTMVTMASAILMKSLLICHKDTLYIDLGQRKWTMIHGSKVGSPI